MPKFLRLALPVLATSLFAFQSALFVGLSPSAEPLAAQAANQTNDPNQGFASGDANAPENQGIGGQVLSGSNGDMFMEEVDTDKPRTKPKSIPIDLSRVGVSVDPHGNIVPLRDNPNDPWAASGVKPFYNHIESTTTMPYAYPNPYGGFGYPGYSGYGNRGFVSPGYSGYGNRGFGYPNYSGYGNRGFGYPSYPGYGNRGFVSPGYSGFGNPGFGYLNYSGYGNRGFGYPSYSGYGNRGFGYPGYSVYGNRGIGYPGYGSAGYGVSPFANPLYPGYATYPGYSPFGVGYVTTGNSATFISNDPITGAPIPQGQQGNVQSNFMSSSGTFTPGFMPGLTAGPWLAPTTSYSQNSMWKAFNLGF